MDYAKPARPLPIGAIGALKMLEAAAAEGRICPSNAEIADAVNAGTSAYGSSILQLLELRGVITIDRSRPVRVVTIVATGASTAVVEGRHPRQGRTGPAQLDIRHDGFRGPPPADRLVDRDPCPRCGARARTCGHTASRLFNISGGGARLWA